MSLDKALYSFLLTSPEVHALVEGRIYPLLAPTQAVLPYVAYTFIAYAGTHDMRGALPLARSSYQLDIYGQSAMEVRLVGEAIRLAIDGYRGMAGAMFIQRMTLEGQWIAIEEDESGGQNKTYQLSQELDLWHDQSVTVFA